MEEILIQGFCLSAKPIAEHDQLLTIFTAELGLLRIYARGILRPQKKAWQLLARPASVSELQLTRGRSDLWNLADGQLLYYPDGMNHSWDQLQGILSMIRTILDTQWLGKPAPELMELLLACTQQLANSYHPSLLALFYLKLLTYEGHFPFSLHCSACGEACTENLHLDGQADVLCRAHAPPDALIISMHTHEVWKIGSHLRSFQAIRAWECPECALLERIMERMGTPRGSGFLGSSSS